MLDVDIKEIRDQYQDYPYPKRDPYDEKHRLITTITGSLDRINFYGFEGKYDFKRGFQALILGGGVGDEAIFLAEQLKDLKGEVIYLDSRPSSIQIAKERARIRKLNNIFWIEDKLENLPKLNLGTFQYIFANSLETLNQANLMLDCNGIIALELPASHTEAGLSEMRRLIKSLEVSDTKTLVGHTKEMLESLKHQRWFEPIHNLFQSEIEEGGDITIYDLFIKDHEKAYNIIDIYNLAESQALEIVHLCGNDTIPTQLVYDPTLYLKAGAALTHIKSLELKKQQAIAEVLNGHIRFHRAYLAKGKREKPDISNLNMIPYLANHISSKGYQLVREKIKSQGNIQLSLDGVITLTLPKSEHMELIMKYFDGKNSLKQIFEKVTGESENSVREQELLSEFKEFYNTLRPFDWIYLGAIKS